MCLILCDRMDCHPPGSSVHEILQARILQWVAISYFKESSQPRDQNHVSYFSCTWKVDSLPLQSVCTYARVCLLSHFSRVWLFATLWTVACQVPLVHGILQARTLEWLAMPSSSGSSQPRDRTRIALWLLHCRWILDSFALSHQGSPYTCISNIYWLVETLRVLKEQKN